MQIDLGPVEGSFARRDVVGDFVELESLLQSSLSHVPLLVGAQLVVGTRRELRARRHPEELVQVSGVRDDPGNLVLDLVLGAEDVGVVLRDHPDAQQPVQRASQFVAVQRRGLGVPDRQLAVTAQLGAEEQHVPRAVHRLHSPGMLVHVQLEHQVFVLGEVTRGDECVRVVDDRRPNLEIAALRVLSPADLLQLVEEHHPLRVPEGGSR